MRESTKVAHLPDALTTMRKRRLFSTATIAAAIMAAASLGFFAGDSAPLTRLGFAPGSSGKVLVGRATVIDGDTVELHGEHVRFNGIDAPETSQTCKDSGGGTYRCGSTSAAALDSFLARSRPLRCEFVSRDRYGRFVGDCFRADGRNVAAWVVRRGHALDWPRYSQGGRRRAGES
jgi:endonuclease YncB( thermonuclease family)